MSLENVDENENDLGEAGDKPKGPVTPRETTDTQIGNASASAPAAQAAAPPPTGKPIEVPNVAKNRPARSRAGRDSGSKTDDSKSASGEGSAEEGDKKEPFRLPEDIFNDIVAVATRDAANKATKLVFEDIGFSNHLVMRTAEEVMKRCQAAAKTNEAERTPTQAAAIETKPVEEIVDAEVVEVIEETSAKKEKSTTAETPKKKVDDDSHGILIAIVVIIAIVILWFAFYPSSPDNHRPSRRQTTSNTETNNTVAMSAARPIASSSSPTPEAIEAFTARVPYSRTERLIALRQLRGTGSDDVRDMNCEGTGTNFSTRAFAERRTVDGNIDMRQLSQSEAQAYFADPAHTGELVVDAEGGPRTYTVYLDLRTRVNETGGGCNFYISN